MVVIVGLSRTPRALSHAAMSAAIFDGIAAGLKADPTIAKKANGVFQFNLSKPASEWVVDCKAATVKPGKAAKADVTLTLSDADFVAMAAGKLNGMQAFMSGKLKIKVRARRPPSRLHPRLHRALRSYARVRPSLRRATWRSPKSLARSPTPRRSTPARRRLLPPRLQRRRPAAAAVMGRPGLRRRPSSRRSAPG